MSKHKYIETPEKMEELFNSYRKSLKPREIQKATNKGVQSEWHTPPLTMAGFEVYCYKEVGCIHQYFANQNDLYNDYVSICSHIRKIIRQDQIEGGMVGQYNSSITQRLNGLTEKTDVTTNGQNISEINITVRKNSED